MMNTELVLWVSLAIGLLFGICGQLSGFCFYRGLTERWSGCSGYKLQGFALALAVALAGTQLVAGNGLVSLDKVLYLNPTFSWLLVPLGGLMFGAGMTLANGCGARALVLLGQGNLRSLVVVLCLGIAAYMTLT
ncbi:YeeE/YedE thiosulfate transporter family protein, partial [Alcaligenes pakistanensis]